MKILYCFPVALVIPLIIGAKQFLLGQSYTTTATEFERVQGLFVLANSFARFLFVTLFASIPLFYYDKGKRIPLFLLMLATVATIISLKVRGVFLTMIIAFFLLFYFTPKIRKYLWVIIPVLSLLSYPLILKLFEHMIHPLPHRIYGGETLNWRIDMWRQLIQNAFVMKPIIGFGIGTSVDVANSYAMTAKQPHNDYLKILIENGILSFVFYCMFFISNLRFFYKEIKNEENRYFNVVAFILLFSYAIISSAANVFYSTDYFMYFFGFLAIVHKMNNLDSDKITELQQVRR